ncbi:tyrosine-type recombinase/integrase [Actinotignum sp. GS-2025e]|uniref:tyrosine-type recombinase/integrase n=1 Tax=unclassified Actinotignum TaxID=2632702 RepID=UPI003F44D454
MARALFGTVRQRGKGRYQGRYRVKGREYYTPMRETKTAVRNDLTQVHAAIIGGTWEPAAPTRTPAAMPTLEEWAEQWIGQLEGIRSPNTIRSYTTHLRHHILPVAGDYLLTEITEDTGTRVYERARAGRSLTTARNVMLTFSAAMTAAVKAGLIDASPVKVTGGKGRAEKAHESVALTPDQVAALLECAEAEWRVPIMLMAVYGLRVGELVALERRDIDTRGGVVSVRRAVKRGPRGELVIGPPKSRAGNRRIPLTDADLEKVKAHLRDYVPAGEESKLIYRPGLKPGVVSDRGVLGAVRRAGEKAGLPKLWNHDLRHTALTNFGAAGATLADLMALAGHTSAETVMIYQHSSIDRGRELAERVRGA